MMILFIIAVLAIMLFIFNSIDEKPIVISKHTKYLNVDIVCSILRSIQYFEKQKGEDIQYLLNTQSITKEMIESYADNLLFQAGEFPAESLTLDSRDFARLIDLHMDLLQGATDSEIRSFIKTLY